MYNVDDANIQTKLMEEYDDIINLPHHVSQRHKPMDISKRAAQFAPFNALSGFEDAIHECDSSHKEIMESINSIEDY